MEIHEPLRDSELANLADKMSPMEFDQIARTFLGITKVKIKSFERLIFFALHLLK